MTEPRANRPAVGQIPYLELDGTPRTQPPPTRGETRSLTTMLPGRYAAIYRAIPLFHDGQKLTVAMVNPHDAMAVARLQEGAGCQLQPVPLDAGTFSRLYAAIYQPRLPTPSPNRPDTWNWWWVGLAMMAVVSLLAITGWVPSSIAVPFLCAVALILLVSWFIRETV